MIRVIKRDDIADYAGITLAANRSVPAAAFYKKKGFSEAAHVMYLYKEAGV